MAIVDIVIPVYGALDALRRCVDSVLASSGRTRYEIIVVNDHCGDDAELARYLHELAQSGRATVIEQPTRQGYAAAVNRAFGLHRDRDVVILQSDAEVANDWLDRLARHAAARDIGVVGTFTDNVGVATYPLPRGANSMPAGYTVAALDALFARAKPVAA